MGKYENFVIESFLEKTKGLNWSYSLYKESDDCIYAEMETSSPLGENFFMDIYFEEGNPIDTFMDGLHEYYLNFDPEDHAAMWIVNRGKNGTPNSIRALIDDAYVIKDMIQELYEDLKGDRVYPNTGNIYTFLILDFDGTYDMEPEDSYEMEPMVYLIKEKDQLKAEQLARKASKAFNDTEGEDWDTPIGELFEKYMEKENIFFQLIGELRIPFGERQTDYLPDYLPRVIV